MHARCTLVAAGAALAWSAAALAQADPCARPGEALRAQGTRYTVFFQAQPQPVVGKHFALIFAVCGPGGAASPQSVEVDARMPAHGHGMNYRPTITPMGAGRLRAEGLMFHMPGEWELSFLVSEAGTTERITHTLVLR